ncbi:MAG: DNA polymerase III subunit alpha [Cellvibrionales bacterium TMED49]|nr:MAG: DNA polymerase III subunit alpha [Cellvibrionales bacterium TMED49]
MTESFVHLRLRTEYSLEDSLVRIKPLIKNVVQQNMPAVAVTDFNNFFALVKFYKEAEAAGVKAILGTDLRVSNRYDGGETSHLLLLVQNAVGYKNLTEIISLAYTEGQRQGKPSIQLDWLNGRSEGLIALSGGVNGSIGQALISGRGGDAQELLKEFESYFPNRFYIELQRTGRYGEDEYIGAATSFAQKHNKPVVATNDVVFIEASEFEAHEARVCIHEGRTLGDPRRERRYSNQQYLRSAKEMSELFGDLPEAIVNSVEIAKRCTINLQLGQSFLPEFPVPKKMSAGEYFVHISEQGLENRFSTSSKITLEREKNIYRQRLKAELEIIVEMGFTGYFLIVMDFVLWAKDKKIPVGPGRGSGAGSLVAYALKITDIDPIMYDLLFERFLNPERVSMPDFDVDFCMDGRDKVIAYVADRYGYESVSQIVTFGTMAAKAVVRDVARVQGKSYSLADRLSKMIPFEVGMTLEKAYAQEKMLREWIEQDSDVEEIWSLALKLEGIIRNCGKHAGGVVIAPTKIIDFSPIYCDEGGGARVTHFDKNDVEDVGLVKFDFLGLRTLTIIDWTLSMINVSKRVDDKPLILQDIPLDDFDTYTLMQSGDTTAVFQLESRGMKELIRKLGPDRFEDIIALVALFRPGPLQSGMVDDFIDRKKGRARISYPHPQYQHDCLKQCLESTYGIILYQEQVMQIAQVMGGFTLGKADLLRRAMGKKDVVKMAEQRESFLDGAKSMGFTERLATNIFELMEKFAGYGFNKSHSAAYALIAYQTAWLKTHYPSEFMAASISSDMDNTDKVVSFIEECRHLDLVLLPPDVNRGNFQFSVNDEKEILYGLGAIKGVGAGPVANIIDSRRDGGPFRDIFDFCDRVDSRKVNKRVLEALIRSGALDQISQGQINNRRATLLASLEEAIKVSEQNMHNKISGISDIFGDSLTLQGNTKKIKKNQAFRPLSSWERLDGERETLGLFLTGHPIDAYMHELASMSVTPISKISGSKRTFSVAGLLVSTRIMKNRRGDSYAFLVLDDKTGRVEISVYAEKYQSHKDLFIKDQVILARGTISDDSFSGGLKMVAESIQSLYEARCANVERIEIIIKDDKDNWVIQVENMLTEYREGPCPVVIDYRQSLGDAKLCLGADWNVKPHDDLLHKLRNSFGQDNVTLRYL